MKDNSGGCGPSVRSLGFDYECSRKVLISVSFFAEHNSKIPVHSLLLNCCQVVLIRISSSYPLFSAWALLSCFGSSSPLASLEWREAGGQVCRCQPLSSAAVPEHAVTGHAQHHLPQSRLSAEGLAAPCTGLTSLATALVALVPRRQVLGPGSQNTVASFLPKPCEVHVRVHIPQAGSAPHLRSPSWVRLAPDCSAYWPASGHVWSMLRP